MSGDEEWLQDLPGFISCREYGKPFMRDLSSCLKEKGIRHYCWGGMSGQSSGDHYENSDTDISGSYFSVIILDSEGAGEGAFRAEVSRIMARKKARKDAKRPYLVWVVFTQDSEGQPDSAAYRAMIPSEFLWFINNRERMSVKKGARSFPHEKAEELAAKIDYWLRCNRGDLEAEFTGSMGYIGGGGDGAVSPPPPTPAHINIEALEHDYMHRSIGGWLTGRVGAHDDARKKVPRRVGLAEAFQFQPERFVEFHGTESVAGGEPVRAALSHWLFRPQLHPLLLVGEGGAGKTTALTAAACGFAGVRDEKLAGRTRHLAAGEWFNTAQDGLKGLPLYVPVVMRCADLCESVAHAPGSPEVLLDAVLNHMRQAVDPTDRAELTDADRLAFRARLRRRAYVLMLDGLDEAPSPSAAERLFEAARQLASDYDNVESALRVIATTRPDHGLSIKATEIDLEPPLLEWDRIEEFVTRFAAGNAKLARQILDRAGKIWGVGDARNAALKTPLMLNAFCCIVREGLETDDYKFTFCRELIDYFLRGRTFEETPRLLRAGTGEAAEAVRTILRRLAYEMIVNGVAQLTEKQIEQVLRANADALRLANLDGRSASTLLREIALQTNLLRRNGGVYGFGNVGILAEFLAAEFMDKTQDAPAATMLKTQPQLLLRPAWRGAMQFKHALRLERLGAHDERSFDEPVALIKAVTAKSDADFAWLACRTALEMVAENPPEPSLDGAEAPELLRFAAQVRTLYEQRFDQWDATRRAAILDLFFQCARRERPEATRRAVERLRTVLLPDVKPWISIALPGGAAIDLAPTPVLAAEYRCFLESPHHKKPEYWPYAANPSDRVTINDPGAVAGESRRDIWIAQMERPGAPVVSISWAEAVAFCSWLTEEWRDAGILKRNQAVRLPRESEWYAMMTSVSGGKRFPWGEDALDEASARVNWCKAGVDRPSAPGVFRATGRPGLYDFGSNVMTWIDLDEPHQAGAECPGLIKRGGGSWVSVIERLSARALCRGAAPTDRFVDCGIRLVRTTGE